MAETDEKIEKEDPGQLQIPANEDMRILEGLFIEKQRELEKEGKTPDSKEIFRVVMKEYLDEMKSGVAGEKEKAIAESAEIPDEEAEEIKKLLKTGVSELVNVALTKGVVKAIQMAYPMPDWFMKALYAELTEKFHEKLVQSRMLKEI